MSASNVQRVRLGMYDFDRSMSENLMRRFPDEPERAIYHARCLGRWQEAKAALELMEMFEGLDSHGTVEA